MRYLSTTSITLDTCVKNIKDVRAALKFAGPGPPYSEGWPFSGRHMIQCLRPLKYSMKFGASSETETSQVLVEYVIKEGSRSTTEDASKHSVARFPFGLFGEGKIIPLDLFGEGDSIYYCETHEIQHWTAARVVGVSDCSPCICAMI